MSDVRENYLSAAREYIDFVRNDLQREYPNFSFDIRQLEAAIFSLMQVTYCDNGPDNPE